MTDQNRAEIEQLVTHIIEGNDEEARNTLRKTAARRVWADKDFQRRFKIGSVCFVLFALVTYSDLIVGLFQN
jgi:hypothetical protein